MNIEVILGFLFIIILCVVLIISYLGIRTSLRKIKECNNEITHCTENSYKNPNDNNWIYMKYIWKNFRTEYVITIWLIGILIIISLSAITYISCVLGNII